MAEVQLVLVKAGSLSPRVPNHNALETMKTALVILFLALFCTATYAQDKPAAPRQDRSAPGGRSLKSSRELQLEPSYKDSAEFQKIFQELYPAIAPEKPLTTRVEKLFLQQSRGFSRQGIDSTKAYEEVMKAIDPKLDSQVIFKTFRALLTAEELRAYKEFMASPLGKKLEQVGPRLFNAATSEVDAHMRRIVMQTLAPLRKPVGTPASETTTGTTEMRPRPRAAAPRPTEAKPDADDE